MSTKRFIRLGTALGVLLTASAALAQNAGSMRGTVTDSSGAVVPGAGVALTNEATKFERRTVTDSKGGYFFASVEPSTYTLTVEIPGFKTREIKGIRLSAQDTRGQDVVLEVGAQSERVTVTASREMIQTETGAREGLISAAQIDNLSVIGRSPLELLRILPGAVTPDQNTLESVGNLTGSSNTDAYHVNGVRSHNNVFMLDGSRLLDIGSNNGVIVVPNNDMVSEVKVQSSNYAAEFGSGGIQVSAVTKGGSSEFHGTLYDYLRHHKFAANDRSNTIAKVDRPKSKFQYPGGNLSGPILIPGTDFNKNRDKAFFFLGVEIQRQQVDPGSSFSVVPTLDQRKGLFGTLGGGQNLNQPTTVLIPNGFPGAGNPAPNGDLSPYIDPTGQALINLFPKPNYSDPNNRYNYVFNTLQPQNRLQLVARFDYNFSDSTRAYVRLARDSEDLDKSLGVWWNSSTYELPTPVVHHNLGRSASANVTSVLSPTTTNEVLFTWSKLKLDIFHKDPARVSLAGVGIPGYRGFYPQQVDVAPVQIYDWGGQSGGLLWDPLGQNVFAYNYTLQVGDTFTKVLNTHALKFGVSVERVGKDQNFQHNEQTSIALGPGWIPGSTGSSFGDLLVGRPAQVEQGTKAIIGNFRIWNLDAFLQDSWKIKKNFTFEYGVRLSKMPNNIENNGHGAVFIPSRYDRSKGTFVDAEKKYLNGVAYAEKGDVPKDLIGNRSLFVMPRLNFAWDLQGTGSWVVRGGAGLFYNRPMGNAEYDVITVPPYAYAVGIDAWAGADLGGQGLTYNTLRLVDPFSRVGSQGMLSVNSESVFYPRTLSTSLSVARRLPWSQVLEAGYVGTFGRHLLNRRRINVIPEGTFSRGTVGNSDLSIPINRVALNTDVVNSFRPFPALGDLQYWEYGGTSNYHSLQVTLSRQSSAKFQYFVAYTFSKVLGLWDNEYTPVDPFDRRNRSYGVLAYDRTHILNLSYNWQLPDPTSKGGVLGSLVNGWQISGISSWSSGIPMKLSFEGALAQGGIGQAWWGTPDRAPASDFGNAGAITPVFTCDPRHRTGTNVGDKLLDINCIGFPDFGQSGPFVSPYYLRSPNRMNHDLTLFKNFKIGKGDKRVQFRAGAFDIFNQAYPTYNSGFEDIDLHLNTVCNATVSGIPNGAGGTADGAVCDPTKGFHFTDQTKNNFGKLLLKRGHRVVEFALKLYF